MIPHYVYIGLKYKEEINYGVRMPCPTMDSIIEAVSLYFGYPIEYFIDKERIPEKVFLRQLSAYLIRKLTNETLVSISNKLGYNGDHTVVNKAVGVIKERVRKDKHLKMQIDCIINRI